MTVIEEIDDADTKSMILSKIQWGSIPNTLFRKLRIEYLKTTYLYKIRVVIMRGCGRCGCEWYSAVYP